MSDWTFAQREASQRLAKLEHFSMMVKAADGEETEFLITVREYLTPKDPAMRFFASADKETNQKTLPYMPTGWGVTLLEALSRCIKEIERFPYHAG